MRRPGRQAEARAVRRCVGLAAAGAFDAAAGQCYRCVMPVESSPVPSHDPCAPGTAQGAGAQPDPSSLPDSPCVAVCSTLFDEICRGCGRTAMEVANWVFFTDEEKQAVWRRIRAQGYPRRG